MKHIEKDIDVCCYKNDMCRNRAYRTIDDDQVFLDTTVEKRDNAPKGSFAVQKGSALLTRKFTLVPETTTLHERKQVYSKMTDIFVKITSLKNHYVQKLVKHAASNNFDKLDDFRGSSKIDAMRVYALLNFSSLNGLPFSKSASKSFELKERVRQCANFEAFTVVRNWLVRNENLKVILGFLIYKLGNDNDFASKFLAGKRFSSNDLVEIWNFLRTNYFDRKQKLSTFYLNNHVYQLRNMFLNAVDFTASSLRKPQNELQRTFKEILLHLSASSEFVKLIANGFTKRVDKRVVIVPENELIERLLNQYFRKIKWFTNGLAQKIVALRRKINKISNQNQTDKREKLIQQLKVNLSFIKKRLFSFVETFDFETKEEFRCKRDLQLDDMKSQFQLKLDALEIDALYQLIEDEFDNEVDSIYDSNNDYVLKHLFKPSFPSIRILNVSSNSLNEYIRTRIRYKVRENLNSFFTTDKITNLFIKEFKQIKLHLYDTVSVPKIKKFSLSLITSETFRENYSKYDRINPISNANLDILDFKLGFISREFLSYKIVDKKARLRKQLDNGRTPVNPTITFKNRKLILNLPFEIKKGQSMASQEQDGNNPDIEMGIDLGLLDFAVVSVWDRTRKIELARYFLGAQQLFDKKLVERNKVLRWQYQARFKTTPYDKRSNIKLKLINLRKQIRQLQRKKNNYEQRLLDAGITNFRNKLKWNRIRKELSLCWDRLHRLNKQIVNLLNNNILTIARFWKVSTIKMENLRWASHSKKRDAGKFMAFWQTHWFYSQVQEAVKFQCDLSSVSFQRVPAGYTSQRCSKCGTLGKREAKVFTCPHCKSKKNPSKDFSIDSDLNASRNVAQYQDSNMNYINSI